MILLFRSLLIFLVTTGFASAQIAPRSEATLGIGDVVKISVYQNPDLSVEARVSETGQINFPLVGTVAVGGLTVSAADAPASCVQRSSALPPNDTPTANIGPVLVNLCRARHCASIQAISSKSPE